MKLTVLKDYYLFPTRYYNRLISWQPKELKSGEIRGHLKINLKIPTLTTFSHCKGDDFYANDFEKS